MSEIWSAGLTTLKPKKAIIIYGGDSHRGSAFATVHAVADGRPPTIMPGREASEADLRNMLRALEGGETTGRAEILPSNILSAGEGLTAWWRPARKALLRFRTGKDVDRISRPTPQPPLVFVASGRSLRVAALERNARPKAGTPLMLAPYLNCDRGGRVCLGGNNLPSPSPSSIGKIEEMFFGSPFSHAGNSVLTRHPGGHDALWIGLEGAGRFPADTLVPMGKNMIQFLNGA